MNRKSQKKQPLKSKGARARNLESSRWHEPAIRYYLLLDKIDHKGTGRYRMVAQLLDLVEGIEIKTDTVKRTLKFLAEKRRVWLKLYRDASSDELLDFQLDAIPDASDVKVMASSLRASPLSAANRMRGYFTIVNETSARLRSILSEAELEWSKLADDSKSVGLVERPFPSRDIVAKAFPDFKN